MIRLKKLYSIPQIFDQISFEPGLNLIIGERSESSDKTNGVGKSVCIEFLNFCLLKKSTDSRVTYIPSASIDATSIIYLDFSINESELTISRPIQTPDKVSIIKDGKNIDFESIDEASDFLGNIYFEEYPAYTERISFRNLLAPVMRDEKSEFKDIIKCFDTEKTVPRDFRPHLFFLGFGLRLYNELAKVIDDLHKKTKYMSETTKLLTNNGHNKVSGAKAKLNELESEVTRINASIEQLKNNDSFEIVQNELISLDSQLKEVRDKQRAIKHKIKQIDSLPQPENISENEIAILFNQFKSGLGDMVKKSIDDVKTFKAKIDTFRNTIVNENLDKLRDELQRLNEHARKLDDLYSQKLSILDNGELLGNLKSAIRIFNEKNQELSVLRSLITQYTQAERDKKLLLADKGIKLAELDDIIVEHGQILSSFEQTILDIHERIFGNKQSHFEIRTKNSNNAKEFVEFELRTDDDHSWSTERMKVFIYDMALMFNDQTRVFHPQFLVHDNIFNVDVDSLEKSLNYVYQQDLNRADDFQYILTINRDMIQTMEEKKTLNFDVEDFIRARFSKTSRFLKIKYNEVKRKSS